MDREIKKQTKQKEEWNPQVIKWQEVKHYEEYTPNGKNTNHYVTIEHEAVILYDRFSGKSRIIKHDVVITGEKE
jgi:stress-induced morphogen